MTNQHSEPITKDDYIMWRNLPITKNLFSALQQIRDRAKEDLGAENVVMSPNCQVTQVRLLGIIEGLDVTLQMQLDEHVEEPEELS